MTQPFILAYPPTEYVLGFAFNYNQSEVLLVKKARPEWQKGKFNGIGGKVEPNEQPADAMGREWMEETDADEVYWNRFAILRGGDVQDDTGFIVHCFCAIYATHDLHDIKSQIWDEPVQVVKVEGIPFLADNFQAIHNLGWLTLMAISSCKKDWPYHILEKANWIPTTPTPITRLE